MKRRCSAACALLLALGVALPAAAQNTRVLIISGLGGDQRFVDSFYQWSLQILDAARAAGVAEENLIYLAEDPARDPERIRAKSTRENVLATLAELAEKVEKGDPTWVVMFGHGSYRDGSSRFNLPGPDLTDVDLEQALQKLDTRQLAVVNTGSASGGFVTSLSSDGRVVVTATKSAGQRNETVFGGFFADAFVDAKADEDKDGAVSVLEAFAYARREVARHYATKNLLATEQAVLDDNGDGKGSPEPGALGGEDGQGDGLLASRLRLAPAVAPGVREDQRGLVARRASLQEQLDELRRQKASMDEELYLSELERLLLEIATIDQQLRGSSDGGASDNSGSDGGAAEAEGSGGERPAGRPR